jgi:septal ring factor EnvC (AmiA/AmiB activator)
MADGTRLTQMQREIDSIQSQLTPIAKISDLKKQLQDLTASMHTISALLKEKNSRSDYDKRDNFKYM